MSNKLSTIKVTLLRTFNYSKLSPFFVEPPQTIFDKKVLYKKLFMLDSHVAQPYTACDLSRGVCLEEQTHRSSVLSFSSLIFLLL